jgi:manganese oxidase
LPPNDDRSMLTVFASLTSVAAFLLAAIGIIVVVNKDDGPSTGGASAPVAVTMTEYAFTPSAITVPLGGSLAVSNGGAIAHNLSIEGGPATADLSPGQSETLDLSDLPAGTYRVVCTIPGHESSGMVAELTIGGTGGAAGETAAGGTMDHSGDKDWAAMDQAMLDRSNQYLEDVLATVADPQPNMYGGVGPLGTPTEGRGNQKLEPNILPDGTKEFVLDAKIVDWEVEPGEVVQAWTYNGMVPSPWIRVEPNDKVRVVLTNNLPIFTEIHFHGITTPFGDDGVVPFTQEPINPGETYTYEFTAPNRPELGMYHPHNHGDIAVINGMFGVFQVGDVPLPRGETINGVTVPEDLQITDELPMVLNDAGVIGLTLNGKSFPATDPIVATVGTWNLVHYYNEGLQSHPMHLHHVPQLVVARDGFPLESPFWVDTLNVAPGERFSVLIQNRPEDINVEAPPGAPLAETLGIWAYHCHILTHAESEEGLFGMVTAYVVAPAA